MKANELRIGSLVTINGGNDYSNQKDHTMDAIDIDIFRTDEKRFSPSPLTPERIAMFGFEHVNAGWFKKGYSSDLTPSMIDAYLWIDLKGHCARIGDKYGSDYESWHIAHIPYVHTLQNAWMVLTSEELKIQEL